MKDGFHEAPLVVGTLVGMRVWFPAQGRLWPCSTAFFGGQFQPWFLGENVAECRRDVLGIDSNNGLDAHEAPLAECQCGFWAFTNGENEYARPHNMTGLVQGYGRVVAGPRGFRAEKARIVALVEPDWSSPGQVENWALLQANYRTVPVFPSVTDAVAAFPLTPIDLSSLDANEGRAA